MTLSTLLLLFSLSLSLSVATPPQAAAPAPAKAEAKGLPCVLAPPGAENAPILKDVGINPVCALSAEDVAAREPITTPGIAPRAGLASPTRVPWVNANGWRFRRNPKGKFAYDVQAGRGALAAAEAFVYGADAALKIDPADAADVNRMFVFFAGLPAISGLHDIADIGVIDDGSPITGEVMNLLERRNLLFDIVKKPSPRYKVNIAVGSKQYPQADAADPSGFALKVRHQLTDDRRTLRIYGSEVVVARLTGDAHHVRLQLLNYSGRELQGLRIRLRGAYQQDKVFIAAASANGANGAAAAPSTPPPATLSDFVTAHGATEFSVPVMGTYAVIDLTRVAAPQTPAKHAGDGL